MFVYLFLDSFPLKFIPSPPGEGISGTTTLPTFSDSEALILVDIVFIKDRSGTNRKLKEDMQIASIQFNNLDVVGKYYVYVML